LQQVDADSETVIRQYLGLFIGLGTFKSEYTIRLRPDTAIYTPRKVLLPLCAEVEKELQGATFPR
jgi:hypothetical protein